MKKEAPIDVLHLLPELDSKLIDLLKSLSADEWQLPTVAKLWRVKDVAAHLLDGNIRVLSMLRDGNHNAGPANPTYQGLVDYLNGLNADWVKAMRRVSPQMLISLHELTGKPFYDYYASLNPFDKATFSVAWVGEDESTNWMHIAREYTEKFLHQQQIRDAVNKPGLLTSTYYYPFINIMMLALPYTYRNTIAAEGTLIKVTIEGNAGGSWFLLRTAEQWKLTVAEDRAISSEVILDPDDAWRLFSKSIRPDEMHHKVKITGDINLGQVALTMVSVMA